jgi:hypothetical protein
MRDAQTQTNCLQTPPNYQPIQTVSQPFRPSTFSSRTSHKPPPIKRCKLYETLNISRTEGAKLCAAIGLGRRRPLDEDEANCLSAIAKTYQTWKAAGQRF